MCFSTSFPVVTSQSPAPGSCIHFLYPQQATHCLPFANCSGAQCNMTYPRGHASFVVHKCQDPVAVDLNIVTGNSVFHRQFNHSESVSNKFITMSRNATHLHFEVRHFTLSGNILASFPGSPRVQMKIFCTASDGKLGGAWERGWEQLS